MEDRIQRPALEYYRETYKDSPRATSVSDLKGKTVIVYCEQGFGDIIQAARYFALLAKNNTVVLHCPVELHRLFLNGMPCVEVCDKNDPELPPHDVHVLSMDLFDFYQNVPPPEKYLTIAEVADIVGRPAMGICWEGKAVPEPRRSCPLKHFFHFKNWVLFSLQHEVLDEKLVEDVSEFEEVFGIQIEDFYDAATMINAVDLVVSVDTAILHLAGAMGKQTYGILMHEPDERWRVRNWYPSVRLFRQSTPGDWEGLLKQLPINEPAKHVLSGLVKTRQGKEFYIEEYWGKVEGADVYAVRNGDQDLCTGDEVEDFVIQRIEAYMKSLEVLCQGMTGLITLKKISNEIETTTI
jgi:hypothetical protein